MSHLPYLAPFSPSVKWESSSWESLKSIFSCALWVWLQYPHNHDSNELLCLSSTFLCFMNLTHISSQPREIPRATALILLWQVGKLSSSGEKWLARELRAIIWIWVSHSLADFIPENLKQNKTKLMLFCKLKVVFLFPNETIYLIFPLSAIFVSNSHKLFSLQLSKFQVVCGININLTNETWKLSDHIFQFYGNIEIKETCKDWNNKTALDISFWRNSR